MEDIAISVVAKAAEYMVDPIIRHGQYMFCVTKILRNLEKSKDELTSTRDDVQSLAEQAKRKTEIIENHVERWFDDVKNLLDKAEKLKEEVEANNNCFHGQCLAWKRYRLCKQLAKTTDRMAELIKSSKFESFSHPASLPSIEYESSGHFTYFEATKQAYDQLIEALKDDSSHMMGLYGIGGSGKTSLAIEVGKKAKESNLFDLVIKVVVSQTPNIGKIQETVADFLNLKFDKYSEEGRKQQLWMRLKQEKRVLIILDDVWRQIELKDVGIDFDSNQKGSCKVLLTTRRYEVCTSMDCQRIIMLALLSEEESWALFKKYARIEDQCSSNILNMAQQVAAECKGLPIAIKAVASSLKGKWEESKVHEWKVALRRLKDSEPLDAEGGEAFYCLKLSYDYLENKEAMLLFLMCAMFPEDYEIPIEDLIRYRVGLGVYKEFDFTRSQVRAGLDKLVDSCLLMSSEETDDYVKMHDLVRDTAIWISSRQDRIMVNTDEDLNSFVQNGVPENCFAVSSWYRDASEISCQWDAPKLEILILNTGYSWGLSCASFNGMNGLKVVTIINENRVRPSLLLRESIQCLNNLQTLCLRRWDLGDISYIVSLRKLVVLDLQCCSFKEVPEGIEELNKLKLLDLRGSDVMKNYNSEGIGRCPQLEELYISSLGIKYLPHCSVNDLASAKLQRYELTIGGHSGEFVQYVVSSMRILKLRDLDVSTIVGSRKNLLQKAEEVQFCRLHGGFKSVIPDMIRAVGGMKELRTLRLDECKQIEFLIDADSFQEDALFPRPVNLVLISLHDLKEVFRGRPVLGLLEKLEKIRISKCRNVLSIFPKEGKLFNLKILYLNKCGVATLFSVAVAASLRQLAELSIYECASLRHIITSEGGEISVAVNNSHSIFPNLKKLNVSRCDKLQFVFPISCGQQGLAQINVIRVDKCDELKYVFGRYDHEHNNSSHDDQNEIQIMLPSLQVFRLYRLGNLIDICPKNCHASWPSLRELHWRDCPLFSASWICSQQHPNVGVAPHDDDRKLELEMMKLSHLFELRFVWSHTQILSFQYLRRLEVDSCSRQKYIFPRAIHINLPQLAYLRIANCDELEEIIAKNEEDHSNAQVCLPELKKLIIVKCDKLKSLFSVAMIRTLPQLGTLCVRKCVQLEEIFRRTANEEEIVLPNLSQIALVGLPSLVDICPGFALLKSMQLEVVCIKGCPNFSLGATQVFPLDYITEEGVILWEINTSSNQLSQQQMPPPGLQSFLYMKFIFLKDNPGVQLEGIFKVNAEGVLHIAQNSLHLNLRLLSLKNLPELRYIWSGPISILRFHKLKAIILMGCPKLKTIFPPGIVGSLQKLRYLIVSNCEELEEIIDMSSDLKVVCFPNLEGIAVHKCSKLKCLFSASLGCDFPKLLGLCIKKCKKLKCLFSGSMICNLPELECIKIAKCSELERVFHFKPSEANDDEDKDHGEQQLVLPKLEELELKSLPNFIEMKKLKMQVKDYKSSDEEMKEEEYESSDEEEIEEYCDNSSDEEMQV